MKIKRARGHRLYTVDGKKILDLSMDRARAVIGHRPNGLSLTLKNNIERGIYSSYDSVYRDRLIKYLGEKFPEYGYVTFLSYEEKVEELLSCKIADPLLEDTSDKIAAYWRPFLKTPGSEHLVLLYPVPGLNTVTVLISRNDPGIESDRVSPILLAGILRSMYDYDMVVKKFKPENYGVFSDIEKTTLIPPYLIMNRDEEEYKKIYEEALNKGIMLNDSSTVQVLWNEFSKGEEELILKLLNGR